MRGAAVPSKRGRKMAGKFWTGKCGVDGWLPERGGPCECGQDPPGNSPPHFPAQNLPASSRRGRLETVSLHRGHRRLRLRLRLDGEAAPHPRVRFVEAAEFFQSHREIVDRVSAFANAAAADSRSPLRRSATPKSICDSAMSGSSITDWPRASAAVWSSSISSAR